MIKYKKAICAAIGAVILSLPSAARSDDTYNFSITTFDGGNISAFGSFVSNENSVITSVNGTAILGSYTFSLGNVAFGNIYNSGSSGSSSMLAGFVTNGISNPGATGGNIVIQSDTINVSQNSISGNINIQQAYHQTNGVEDGYVTDIAGFFQAVLAPTGGSGSGGGANSGGAPSPEVNAFLGLALVGGTVAFLRRRRTESAA
ncbi:hypothetical protein MMSR116_11170 [Methylobacterium mesophilicum SR1.6/6]|uniref:PEP-CTERM sorting domain-containing protein n=1 Tax=Methylobacterium mesophilicum SR1.6/6 TaxID=908290 RepID=A0A6B9FIC5_9HYPH|nr:hypothetical protein [Methylobacterium mesophilicum]QGY02371.1 hypothetical protein MMSR116_11170 [Methylobacterium mesophilicum SR1.6/6]